MKRLIALFAALLLIMSIVPALAENDTLMEKFYQQAIKKSAYRGTVTFSVSGEGTKAVPQPIWQALQLLAPQVSLNVEHTTTPNKEEGEASLSLIVTGMPEQKTVFSYDESLIGLTSNLLGDASYTADKGWDWSRLLQPFTQGENTWPPVWRMLLGILNSPESWKEKAKVHLNEYETKLGVWINTYASVSMGTESGRQYSELSCSIPAQAVKNEMKQLLLDLYQDAETLSLLREVVTPQEAAAYLQPSQSAVILAMVDQLRMEGNLELARRHDAAGNAMLDRMSFPFAEDAMLSRLEISVSPDEAAQKWRFAGAGQEGIEFDISCTMVREGTYEGTVDLLLPADPDEQPAYVVDDGALNMKPFAFDYSLTWDPGEEAYSLADDQSTQVMRGSLMIRPIGDIGWPEQVITLEAQLSSGSSKQSSTHLDVSLVWWDMETDAFMSAMLTSRTVAPFDYTKPSDLKEAVRLDQLAEEERMELIQGWSENLSSAFTGMLLPANSENAAPEQ